MAHSGMVITNKGKILQAKVQAGAVLEFTKIMLGDGVLQQSASLELLNALISPKMTINISSVNAPGDGTCAISSTYTNTDLKEGFQIREMGLFARDPDAGEVLYSIDNAGDEYAYLPAGGGLSVFENSLTLVTIIGNATNVTAVIDEGKVFATKKELTEHAADEDIHTPAFNKHNASKAAHQGGISGNAATATKLQTARTIALGGAATGTATSFDGESNITIPVTSLDASKLTGTAPVNTTGNAATATKLQTARTVSLSGKATGTATSFDGSSNITIPITAVTADSCTGNSATATKATQDSDGNQINNTYTKKSTFASDVISALASKTLSSLGVAYSMGSTGYVAFGDLFGGLIIQWGSIDLNINSMTIASLPLTFPTAFYTVSCSGTRNNISTTYANQTAINAMKNDLKSFTAFNDDVQQTVYFIALGR